MIKILATREYQLFIKEWLELYDKYFSMNPKPFGEVKKDCEYSLLLGFLDKVLESNKGDIEQVKEFYNFLRKYEIENCLPLLNYVKDI